ncbi:SpaA isopeptide-forming pilin-related protein [Mediterraneibacter faecis]|uniref:SpaA isopeptide-forming pilin-related protein n=1 Tax=Mediterraneibacter faecis TaxID=592978 RepID=UPI0022DF503C|nr:Cna B-type domain-containing protein [Mediterraneibacter faecis]
MKKTKVWLRWIALTLLVILCINSVGSIALASEIQEEGYDSEAELLEEKSSTEAELQNEEGASEEKSQEEGSVSEEKSQEEGSVSEESNTPEDKTSPEQQEAREASSNTQEVAEGYDIDFYVIINGEKVKLQHNNITGIKTWKEKRTTYYGVSLDDLILVYEEFGFVKGSDGQNPVVDEKFVSAYRGKSRIEYGKVYTDTDSGKTYVSYNYGQNKQGEAIDVYYLPNGKGVALNLKDSVKKDNSFYSVEVKGEGQDRIRYALTGTVVEEAVADFNPQLSDQTDQIEWTCMGTDDKVIDGIRESGNQTRFTIGKITQSYVIQRADQTAFDIQFYIYADNEVRKLPADSLKKVYKWNRQGRCYLSVSDLAEIYREFGLNAEETQSGNYFPYTVRGEKTLAQATVVTYKGQQYVSYNLDKQEATVPTDVYYMPKGASDGEKIPDNNSDQIKQNKNSFYSVTVINPDGNRTVSYYKKDSAVTISVDPGDTKESDWLCASEDENKTISPVKQGDKLTFSIGKIEQPYTVACNTFAPATLNIKFYTFVNNERYNVLNEEIPVIKDTTTKPGTVYYYISNDELKKHFEKFHYDGSIQNEAKERFYYSKRDYDTIHNAGKYTIEGHECIYIGKSGEPMDVYYLPNGEKIDTMSAKTLFEHDDYRYNGFYSVTVQDEDGQVYSQTALRDLPAIDFVARKSTLTRTVSTKPRVEEQTQEVNWECREEDGTLSTVVSSKNAADHTMSFTIQPKEAVRPYVIVPDNTEKPATVKEANISFYVFIDGHYKLIKNLNAEQHYIIKANSGRASRYYLRAKPEDTISQIYREFGFTPDKLEPEADGKEKILFGYATDSRVFVQHPYKDNDGTWYIPVLKNGKDVSVYYFSKPNPLNPDKIENYFDRLTGLSSQVGLAGRNFSVEGSFHLIEVLDPLNLTKREAIKRQYVGNGEAYTVEVPKKASLEGEYYDKDIVWSCTSNDKDAMEVFPKASGADKVKFEIPSVKSSYEVIADKPLAPGAVRVIYNTTRYMKKLPKEAKLTPQVGNKTRHTDDYPSEEDAASHVIKSPYPLVYDHEDNDSKELEQYEFDHWDYRNQDGKWQECNAGDNLSEILNDARRPITLYASWSKVSNQNRKQVQFYICKSAMPEDGSVALPSVKADDYTSAVAVANCNVKASIVHDVSVLGNKDPTTWEHYAQGDKRVRELLQGTKPDEGYIGNEDYIYKIDRIPSDEEVFQTIRESGRMIRIGDREIPPSKLDTEFFTIYWYSFKSEMSDGWHIDGRIVAKNGYLTVKKDFVGMPEAIEEVKKDYYIQVDMDEKLLDGKPQPPAFHEHMKLVLPSEDSQKPDAEAPQAENAPIEVVGTWTDETHTSCTWIVKADSFWKYTLKEYNYKPKDSNVKFSGWYNVRNSHEQGDNVNSWEAYPESGIQFTGRGIGRGGETLTIELENRYQKEGILTLNKFDESTGQGMEKINFAVSKNGVEEETVTTDKYGIAQLHIPLQDENKQNRTATETYLLRETNLPTGYVDTGDIQITVEIANGTFKIIDAKLVDRAADKNQEAVTAPVDGKINGKSVLLQRGDTSLNIRNFAKTGTLHIKKTWGNPNDALMEKQVKIRLYQNGISTGQEFLLNEENGWEHTVDNVPLFQDRNPVEYKVEEIEIGKTHYSSEYGDGFLYYEVIYPEIQYFDSNGQQLFPKDENEFKDVSKMELEVQNLHFNLAERSFLKTDDLPRNRLAGAGFLFYKVPYDDVTKEYADDTGYTVDYDNTQSKDEIVLKKDGQKCNPDFDLQLTDENGMLQLSEAIPDGRYWMVESVTPNKKDKADKTKTQYQDNFNLYMVDVESDILFLYEKSPMTNTWRAVSDRHIVNHPQKGGVTVEITKEVTGPLGNRKKPFDMEILYWEDGQKLCSKTIRTSLKHGDKVTLKNVDISSDIIITETVDTSKYAVSISKKEENDKYSNPVQATSNGNTAVMKQQIEAARGDVIELKITNKNTESIPATGIHLAKNQQVCILLVISIAVGLIFWRKNKNKAMRR